MATLHEDIKLKKQQLEALKAQANNIAMQRVRVESELEQHQKIEATYIRQMKEAGYDSIDALEKAMIEKQGLLHNVVGKLDRMVAGEAEETNDENFDFLEEDDDLEF